MRDRHLLIALCLLGLLAGMDAFAQSKAPKTTAHHSRRPPPRNTTSSESQALAQPLNRAPPTRPLRRVPAERTARARDA